MPQTLGTRAWKALDYVVCKTAGVAFDTIQFFNKHNPNPNFTPKWSDKPLLKSWEKSKPTLGWPRQTDSLCPGCVKEARDAIFEGKKDWRDLMHEKVGEIKAQIIERDGQIWMVKECPIHGQYEDMMAIDAKFLNWIEQNFPGRDIPAHNDEDLHKHGSSTVRYGRGSVLTVDLTNRCNMMCDPCFMDANQVGYVHELSWEEIQEILDNALKIKPRRQMSVQFSGGEPTMHPRFFDAIRHARKIGYNSVQAATNGIEFAKSKEYCKQAFEAGLRYVYLQFDGIGNDANSHRQVGNLFDVKLRAIENMHAAGIEIILVTTIVNNLNNDQVGAIVKFAMENPKKISFVAFQPVSFTGRDEEITPERRMKQRYTLSHLAQDVSAQVGKSRADARLVPDFDDQHVLGICRSFARAGIAMGLGELRLPPELRRGHGRDDQQGNQGMGSGSEVPERAATGRGHQEGHRRGPRQEFFQLHDGAGAAEELQPVRRASNVPPASICGRRFDKSWGLTANQREEVRHGGPGAHLRRRQEAPQRSVELPVHRRHVVPGPVQLRFPPHRNVHHPVRDAAGRNFLLRVQHGHRLAEDHREHVQERDRRAVVQGTRQARDLRQGQGREPRHVRALAGDRCRGRRARPRASTTKCRSPPPRRIEHGAAPNSSRKRRGSARFTRNSCSRRRRRKSCRSVRSPTSRGPLRPSLP